MTRPEASEREARPAATLLLAYSDPGDSATLVGGLSGAGVAEVVACPVSRASASLIEDVQPDLILLQAPAQIDPLLACCERIRGVTERPVAVLSALADTLAITRTLDTGIDEYFVLPMDESELVARVAALVRRWRASPVDAQLAFGGLRLSPDMQTVDRAGRTVDLTPMEYRLLACLIGAQGNVVTHDYLMANVWGAEYVDSRHYLHLYIRYLREKLEDDPKQPQLIVSEWGIGYRLQPL